ncbi:MAG TPA: NADPH-dependent assimilatory sulfite reductase hemoprotein subunit, partial [Paludibacter sp.]|nr:NADPH-dependent assimilatory sulfite reductase hemoprotein subunit [Paludibacter sp.]
MNKDNNIPDESNFKSPQSGGFRGVVDQKLSEVERIKTDSNYLRGTIREGLADPITASISPDDQQLIKLHGAYQQQDRDLDDERRKQKLEPLYSFLIRIRVPGGIATAKQWLDIDTLADKYGNPTIKLTTRQAFELHGVVKRNLKATIQGINQTLLDTLAACGDVNRNVMTSANPWETEIHQQVYLDALGLHTELSPKTTAYHEIWLDDELVAGGEKKEDHEPLYGKTYLPRKFKIAVAIPPRNDVDVYANDLGFIAIAENGKLLGYNIVAGGGMGMTFGVETTYPRLADLIGFVAPANMQEAAKAVIAWQRDNGNRSDRKNARLKYTIDRLGLGTFKTAIKTALGDKLEPYRPYSFSANGDNYGWKQGYNGKWYYTLFVEGGKVKDTEKLQLKAALKDIASQHNGTFILTGNQNLVIADVESQEKDKIDGLLLKWKLGNNTISGLRRNSLACVALPVCGMAFAEAERYLPSLVDKIEVELRTLNLIDENIILRMTGCPNGCARPYLGEIGLVGKSPGKYNLYLGAGFTGDRLNKLYAELLCEDEILASLRPVLADYAANRNNNERFGD